MLDMLLSRMGMLVAVSIILASVFSFYDAQNSGLEAESVEKASESLAWAINNVASRPAGCRARITLGAGGDIGLDGFDWSSVDAVLITSSSVVVESDIIRASNPLLNEVRLFKPVKENYTWDEFEVLDSADVLDVSGGSFIVERREIKIHDVPYTHTFVYNQRQNA